MHDITCPHCRKSFTMDEAGYADILQQVRNREFDQELHQRLELAQKDKQSALALAQAQAAAQLQASAAAKDGEIADLKAKLQSAELERRLALEEDVMRILTTVHVPPELWQGVPEAEAAAAAEEADRD